MEDERKDLPSASKTESIVLCPASHLETIEFPNEDNSASLRGTKIHEAIEKNFLEILNDEEKKTAEDCMMLHRVVRAKVFGKGVETVSINCEQRLWLEDDGKKVFSGKPDEIEFADGKLLIVDYKTGFNPVTNARANLQLRSLAVLSWLEYQSDYDIKEIYVAIIIPNFYQERYTIGVYSEQDMAYCYSQLVASIRIAMTPDQPRIAGEKQCKYCALAKANRCPEFKAYTFACATIGSKALAMKPTNDEMLKIEEAYQLISALRKNRMNDALKVKENDPLALPDFKIQKGRKTQKVSNPADAFEMVKEYIPINNFLEACTPSIPKLSKIIRKTVDFKNDKLAREKVEELLINNTETTVSEPSLKRV